MVSLFGRGFDSLQLHMQIKKGRVSDPFLFIGNLRLETTEATELTHVKFLNLNTGGNLEH